MIAIYRVLYGEEFIERSINSIIDHVDRVYVFWTNRVWGDCTGVNYKGEWIDFPDEFDNVVEVVGDMNDERIHLIEAYTPTPFNQFTNLANRFDEPVVLMEPDMVVLKWPEEITYPSAMMQTEFWKTEWSIPQRGRPGPIFRQPPFEMSGANGWPMRRIVFNDGLSNNYGFCVSDLAMYWKHLTALAFSPKIGDSIPNPDWYENVWLNWTPEMRNLEISLGREDAIPYAR